MRFTVQVELLQFERGPRALLMEANKKPIRGGAS